MQIEGEDGEFVVENLGTILWDLEGYHDADFIYPVGFTVQRILASVANPSEEEEYLFEIRYGGNSGPTFVITSEQDEEFEGASPEEAWDKACFLTLL